jgi:uncharacterized membrane protein YfcA
METLLPFNLDLLLISTFTSFIAGVISIGGGLTLIAILPILVPTQAIIPFHSASQLSSNISRAFFVPKHIDWSYVPKFIGGSVLGVVLFGYLLYQISTHYIPLAIGSYILLNIWSEPFKRLISRYENLVLVGMLQTGLGLIVGATGPLTLTLLMKELGEKEKVVATAAVLMTITHCFKLLFFGVFGFVYVDYWLPIVMLIAGAIVGSWLGTLLRQKIDGKHFFLVIKVLLTLLAIRMIWYVFQ